MMKKRIASLLLLFIGIVLIGCNSDSEKEAVENDELQSGSTTGSEVVQTDAAAGETSTEDAQKDILEKTISSVTWEDFKVKWENTIPIDELKTMSETESGTGKIA